MRIFSVLGIGLLALSVAADAQTIERPPPDKSVHDRLESRLVELARRSVFEDEAARALQHGIKSSTVSVILDLGSTKITDLEAFGARIEARSSRFIRLRVPLEKLFQLAESLPQEAYLRLPLQPWGLAIEGVQETGASAFHSQGIRGQSVRVAVIDVGFTGLSAAIASGRIAPIVFQKDYTGIGLEGGDEDHGAGVTEILSAMAPEAELLLYRIADEIDLENAVEDALKRGVKVINHSIGWVNTDFGDGTGLVAQIAQSAVRRGVVWVNAAGNAAQRHWSGPWQDFDGDGWLNIEGERERITLEAEAGETVEVYLTWNEWPRSRTDYDLYLLYDLNGDGQLDVETEMVASSTNRQSGSQPPTESIEYFASLPGHYHIAVAGPGFGPALRIFSFNHDLRPSVTSGSLLAPAPAPDVIAVGAIDQKEYSRSMIEFFSSQGPTSDGRIKPDLVAPDGVQTSTGRFFGTSASAPFVAGAAALLLSENPTLSPAQLRARLLAQTVDAGPAGPDNVFGAGKLQLRLEALSLEPVFQPGDLTGDSRVDKADLKLLRAYLRGRATLTSAQAAAANIAAPCGPPHDRTTITARDYKALRLAARGKEVTFDCYSQSGALMVLAQRLGPATIQFALAGVAVDTLRVEVFSLSGRKIFQSDWTAGGRLLWNSNADVVANGVYLYMIEARRRDGSLWRSPVQKFFIVR